jgi:hypothetical protein
MTETKVTVTGDEVKFGEGLRVTFQRTLRIPDDGKTYPLPPGLGAFPLRRVDDYADRVPAEWRARGGLMLPMYQREAMWICFAGQHWKPRAVKIGVGKACAITGKPWSDQLHERPQDYVVTPPQPWLDGIHTGEGTIRQFVAMPLGLGYTVEGQVTGEERFGGVGLAVLEPKPGRFPDAPPLFEASRMAFGSPPAPMCCAAPPPSRSRAGEMGLGAGGRMKQRIYPDPHGIDTWDPSSLSRVFVHILNSDMWREITGEPPPPTPVTAREYARHGLPWFDLYDDALGALEPGATLASVKSVKTIDAEKISHALQDDDPVEVGPVKKLVTKVATALGVRDGDW